MNEGSASPGCCRPSVRAERFVQDDDLLRRLHDFERHRHPDDAGHTREQTVHRRIVLGGEGLHLFRGPRLKAGLRRQRGVLARRRGTALTAARRRRRRWLRGDDVGLCAGETDATRLPHAGEVRLSVRRAPNRSGRRLRDHRSRQDKRDRD